MNVLVDCLSKLDFRFLSILDTLQVKFRRGALGDKPDMNFLCSFAEAAGSFLYLEWTFPNDMARRYSITSSTISSLKQSDFALRGAVQVKASSTTFALAKLDSGL